MQDLNKKYLGKDFDQVKKALKSQGFIVTEKFTEGRKDKEILNDKLVIKLEQKSDNEIVVTTTMFKKYI